MAITKIANAAIQNMIRARSINSKTTLFAFTEGIFNAAFLNSCCLLHWITVSNNYLYRLKVNIAL